MTTNHSDRTPLDDARSAATAAADAAAGFDTLGLDPRLLEAFRARLRGADADPARGDPAAARGRDLLGQAATGTGKTAAFALPMLQRWLAAGGAAGPPSALVLVPTRELAMQVAEAVHRYGRGSARGCCRSTAGSRSAAAAGAQARRRRRRRDAGPGARPPPPRHAPLDGVASSCSTRPTRCSTWASPRTSRRSSPPRPRSARRCSSRPRCRRASGDRQAPPARPGAHRDRARAPPPGRRRKVRQTAYVVPRAHKPAALGRVLDVEARRRRSSSAAPAPRSTS
jgi:ATP-dependent RNA helicase DeaD